MTQLPVAQLSTWLADTARARPQLIDVRETWEYQICRIDGSESMPLSRFAQHVDAIDDARPIVCICHHGTRSLQVAMALEHRGCREVYNLAGGVAAWARDVDPTMSTY
jgi:rhodanese-related sulfurtransferase